MLYGKIGEICMIYITYRIKDEVQSFQVQQLKFWEKVSGLASLAYRRAYNGPDSDLRTLAPVREARPQVYLLNLLNRSLRAATDPSSTTIEDSSYLARLLHLETTQ